MDSMAEPIKFDEELNLGSRGGAMAWIEYAATLGLMEGVSRLPHAMQMGLLRSIGSLAMRVDKRHREAARAYMSQALGEEIASMDPRIRDSYVHLFRMSVDSHAFNRRVPQATISEHFAISAPPEVHAAWESGTGGFLATAHIGDWEAGSAAMNHLGMAPAYGVARPPKNRFLSRHLLRVRELKKVTVFPRRGGMGRIASVLKAGGWVGMLLDQRPLGKHTLAPFFGRVTTCERSAGVLFKRMGVPIVFGACYLTDRPFYYDMRYSTVMTPEELADLSLEEVVTTVNAQMEKLILAHPEQYFWLHDRYRDAPPLGSEEEAPEKASPLNPSR